MKARTFSQAGIGHVVILFVVVFVAVVAFAGYTVMNGNKAEVITTSSSSDSKVPEKIDSKADLVQTSKALDDSSSQLDSGLNDDALNADMNDML